MLALQGKERSIEWHLFSLSLGGVFKFLLIIVAIAQGNEKEAKEASGKDRHLRVNLKSVKGTT